MVKRLQEYVKYTLKELKSYTKQDGSCVRKVNTQLHLSLGPYCMADFKHALSAHIMRRKVGYYDPKLEGIVLDIKNIKVLGTAAALRADDPRIHVDVNADCYVFRPVAGAILSGVVKHVGNRHIGVIIYRVFNVSIRFAGKLNKEEIKMDDVVEFCMKKFNLQNIFPYIEGDLVTANGDKILNKFIKVEPDADSGIEVRENRDLDELVNLIKKEQEASEDEGAADVLAKAASKKKAKSNAAEKRKRKSSLNADAMAEMPTTTTASQIYLLETAIKKEPKHENVVEQDETLNTSLANAKSNKKGKNRKMENAEVVAAVEIKEEDNVVPETPTKKKRKRKSLENGTS